MVKEKIPETTLVIQIGLSDVDKILINDEEKGLDLNDEKVQANLGKFIATAILNGRKNWSEYQAKTKAACNCFAKERKYPMDRHHSSNCAVWDLKEE